MRQHLLAIALACIPMVSWGDEPPTVHAQPMAACGLRSDFLATLKRDFREEPVAEGIDASGRHLEILAAPDGRTFTVLATSAGGITCLMGSGFEWQILPAGMGLGS